MPTPTSAISASTRSHAASMPACTAAGSGPCVNLPASVRRDRPTIAFVSCSPRGRRASARRLTCPRSWDLTATIRAHSAKWAGLAWPSITLTTCSNSSTAYETGVTNSVDPVGGSYFLEALTKDMQQKARGYFERIEQLGGMIPAIEKGFFRREIAAAAFAYQREVDTGRKLLVGVNTFQEPEEEPLETLVIDDAVEKEQVSLLQRIKAQRDLMAVQRALEEIRRVAATKQNMMPVLLDAARLRCTVGEIMAALADVFGRYGGAAKW